jgi:hypothetical protein
MVVGLVGVAAALIAPLLNPLGIGDPDFGWKDGLLLAIGVLLIVAGGVTALLSRRGEILDFRALSWWRGRLLVASAIAAYFFILALLGGHAAWDQLGVLDLDPSFADMRSDIRRGRPGAVPVFDNLALPPLEVSVPS